MISCYAHKVRQKYCAKGSRETDFHPLEKVRSWAGLWLVGFFIIFIVTSVPLKSGRVIN